MNIIRKAFVSLYVKIALGILVAVTSAIFLVSYLHNDFIFNYIDTTTENQICSILDSANISSSIFIQNGEFNDLQRMVEKIASHNFIKEVKVYDKNKKIIASGTGYKGDDNSGSKILDELLNGQILEYKKSNFSENVFDMAIPINEVGYSSIQENGIIGVLCIKVDLGSVKGFFKHLHYDFLKTIFTIGALFLSGIISLLSFKLFTPISKLYKAAQAISEGDYRHVVDEYSEREFYPIIKGFNNMTEKIRTRDEELKSLHKKLEDHNEHLETIVTERTSELKLTQDITIRSLANLAETRDNETGSHIFRTQHYVETLAEYLKENPKFSEELMSKNIELMFRSAPLHDIGKVGIPDNILLKPFGLTKEEFEIMKKHTTYGKETIEKSEKFIGNKSLLSFAKEIAFSHHEKWNGSGYPEGLVGEEIPLSARIMAIADVYDALVSQRPYKKAFTHDEAVRIILEGDGRTSPEHFDPDILTAFSKIHHKFDEIHKKHPDEE
ncbi:HD-GYP domain-containing protein [Ilyobacter polytropus]|uniref:Metal dependent phosphohydrolase n=1 Tax=Ilyobacter polytropus (strain ATCC 51220 / DSM 2926 / LMG 16218 / CuHBu1) TaxID=572544 RepID=E3HDV8_ILYPC|nr:HD domain-containing phosphohydrolase [Ilyobacter polytropus]ADO84570.1 metal dependent phosphohydrolase [Ilyobacter polytropus DSM 2926]